jgi:hypothetical protein
MMVRTTVVAVSLALIFALMGCGGSGEQAAGHEGANITPAGEGDAAVSLNEEYSDALSIRSQLMLGTFELEGTDLAVTPEQASELLPLWQVSRSLSRSGTGASEEVAAVLNQIEAAMTPAQVDAIAAMQLTRADNQAMAQEMGLATGTGEGAGSAQRGQGQNLSAEEQATRQAERTGTGASEALLDKLIELLEARR